MDFHQLETFISEQMKMQHIYQPVMLLQLLTNEGQSTDEEIAKHFINHYKT